MYQILSNKTLDSQRYFANKTRISNDNFNMPYNVVFGLYRD